MPGGVLHPALIYAHRVRDADGGVLGVVALQFALTEELSAVRAEVLGDQPGATLAFVNWSGSRYLQSSDGARLAGGSSARTHGDPPGSVRRGQRRLPDGASRVSWLPGLLGDRAGARG
jgi:hypothetical protein